jgi:hypothetical protein
MHQDISVTASVVQFRRKHTGSSRVLIQMVTEPKWSPTAAKYLKKYNTPRSVTHLEPSVHSEMTKDKCPREYRDKQTLEYANGGSIDRTLGWRRTAMWTRMRMRRSSFHETTRVHNSESHPYNRQTKQQLIIHVPATEKHHTWGGKKYDKH